MDIEDAIAGYTGAASPTAAQLHAYLRTLYGSLLANPATAGITVGQRWDNIQATDANTYDWSYLDDAFAAATAVNKSVQLIVTPGFDAPQWLLSQIPSCDALFTKGTAQTACGKATFTGFPEQQRADGNVLPLPWNTVYEQTWGVFLANLSARYSANPAFIAIAIAGPVGASPEMILPTTANTDATQPSGLPVDDTWAALIQHSFPNNASYQKSDQVFIDQWKAAIDLYEKTFSGVTIFLGPDAGNDLPEFASMVTPHADNTLFAQDCADSIGGKKNDVMSCEAKTEILSYFLTATGPNVKSSQVGGMTASSDTTAGDIGITGVKLLTALSPAILGGAEFDHPVSGMNLQEEGCPSYPGKTATPCPNLSIEEAAYNALAVFFDGTAAATFYGGPVGAAPIEYLEIPYADIQYAAANPCPVAASPILGNLSLQDLFNRASHDLLALANQASALPPPTCANPTVPTIELVANAGSESPVIAPNTWVEIKGLDLAPAGDTRIWQAADFAGNQLPAQLDQVSATVNGKAAYVYFISPTQVNILTPPNAINGPVQVTVTANGKRSAPYNVDALQVSPSFFMFNGGPYVVATHLDGSLVGPATLYPGASTPAKPGETVVLYGVGFGATNPAVTSGSIVQSGTLAAAPGIQIGGVKATVQFAGLAGPGEYQFNVVLPATLGNGDQSITATVGGSTTQAGALLTIHN